MPIRTRAVLLIAAAAVAGVIAGTVAVYVNGSANGNGGTAATAAAVNCDDALATAARIAPLARGEVAAFQVATAADGLGDLSFLAPDGKPTTVAALGNKLTLVNLWATWCVPCRAEMPALGRLQAAMGGKSFNVAAINMDVTNPDHAKAFLSEIGVSNLAFYADPSLGLLNDLKRRGLTIGLPTTLLVDGKGCRIGIMEGPAAWDSQEARALIGAAIGGSAPSPS